MNRGGAMKSPSFDNSKALTRNAATRLQVWRLCVAAIHRLPLMAAVQTFSADEQLAACRFNRVNLVGGNLWQGYMLGVRPKVAAPRLGIRAYA